MSQDDELRFEVSSFSMPSKIFRKLRRRKLLHINRCDVSSGKEKIMSWTRELGIPVLSFFLDDPLDPRWGSYGGEFLGGEVLGGEVLRTRPHSKGHGVGPLPGMNK